MWSGQNKCNSKQLKNVILLGLSLEIANMKKYSLEIIIQKEIMGDGYKCTTMKCLHIFVL